MANILFAWELGANLGHLTRDLPLARACRAAGHRVVMAVPNLRAAVKFLGPEKFTLVQTPLLKSSIKRSTSPVNYADMLLHEGYDDVDALAAALTGWEGLFDLAQPALLVYNHAPTALIAARTRGIPVMMIGTGFEVPPLVSPLPSFRPWQDIPQEILTQAEQVARSHINPQLAGRGQGAIAYVSDLFAIPPIQLTTFPELDPFGPRPGVDYVGPLYAMANQPPAAWQENGKPRVFAYLRPGMASCEQLLAALETLHADVVCAIPGAPAQWSTRFPKLRIFAHAIDLQPILPNADAVVTYGASTIATALLAGVPALLIPQVVEQYLTGLPLEKTGAGLMLRDLSSMEPCKSLIGDLLTKPQYRLAAKAFAQRHQDFNVEQAVRRLADGIEQRLATAAP